MTPSAVPGSDPDAKSLGASSGQRLITAFTIGVVVGAVADATVLKWDIAALVGWDVAALALTGWIWAAGRRLAPNPTPPRQHT
jgi:hypothetical protein